jgi:hypothetical protein
MLEIARMKFSAHTWRRLRALTAASLIGILPGVRVATAQDGDDAAWREAQALGTSEAFQGYLDAYPIGRHADTAFACIVAEARGADAPFCGIEPAAGPLQTDQPAAVLY